jgi:2-polyprenyl-6-methoxyphenol hydroxylase-like FAD-dependent oxidoreductase
MNKPYDAIVVGARCAGAPTAMLLARQGHRVLVVDRAQFPSDIVSTHLVQPTGIAALARWGLLERLKATGCPAIHTYTFDFGPLTIAGSPGLEEFPVAYCPRRTVLDKLLVDAAAEAGAEIREAFTVEDLLHDNGRVAGVQGRSKDGRVVSERAMVVIGADGRTSRVALAVRPEEYNTKPPLLAAYYSYWSGLPMDGRFDTYIRLNRGFAAVPTNDGLTLVIAGWPYAEMQTNARDIEGNFHKVIGLAPALADHLRGAKRQARFAGAALPNFFRKPHGPGWVLVGDAAYNKDAITAQGISDAFRDAEATAAALAEFFSGRRPFEDAMAERQRNRDKRVMAMYELTTQLASLGPPPSEILRLLPAIQGNREAMDGFVRMNAGTISPSEYLSPANVSRLMAGCRAAG